MFFFLSEFQQFVRKKISKSVDIETLSKSIFLFIISESDVTSQSFETNVIYLQPSEETYSLKIH